MLLSAQDEATSQKKLKRKTVCDNSSKWFELIHKIKELKFMKLGIKHDSGITLYYCRCESFSCRYHIECNPYCVV
jgi:hypothetical protein